MLQLSMSGLKPSPASLADKFELHKQIRQEEEAMKAPSPQKKVA